jgi:predicted nucleotidyltransferase
MGSHAYGTQVEGSDFDLYGFCIPEKTTVFPHLAGKIDGFGSKGQRFEVWQQHHVEDKEARKEYDFSIYSIVKYFDLCMMNNPNIIDSLFVPQRCIIHSTQIGNLIRENRKMFLHKGAWQKFKGYSYSQVHKMDTKEPGGKRVKIIEKFGWDVKFGMNVVRLLNEVEQILTEKDLDLERNNEQLKSILRGEWTKEQVKEYFSMKEKFLEELYTKSDLPWGPDEDEVRDLLLKCLRIHYGNLDKAIEIPKKEERLLKDLQLLVEKYK